MVLKWESVGNAGNVSLRVFQATWKSFSVEEFISKDLFSFCMGDRVKGNKTGGRELLIHDANAMDCMWGDGNLVAVHAKSQLCV